MFFFLSPDCLSLMCFYINEALLLLQMSNKRSRSFKIAVHCKDREVWSETDYNVGGFRPCRNSTCFQKMVRKVAKEFLVDERDRLYYADNYTCCPPPIFVPIVTLVEVSSSNFSTSLHYIPDEWNVHSATTIITGLLFVYYKISMALASFV